MCTALDAAKEVCKLGNWEVSNLKLQKIMYIMQVFYYGNYNQPLFNASFEAWDYGPVIPSLYHRFKMFGNKPIQEWVFRNEKTSCDNDKITFIKDFAPLLLSKTSAALVGLTHRKESAWYKAYIPGAKGIIIPEEEIKNEYERVWLSNARNKASV